MEDVRVVLIGGTSHTGKSTVARHVARRLGFDCLSTDGLARHPGRPWPTPEWQVPPHVDQHYRSLPVDGLITSVLDHYQRLWPRIEELVTDHARARQGVPGLVLEGSALWPASVAGLTVPRTGAVWLTADESVLTTRVRTASRYSRLSDDGRAPVDGFLARTLRYQRLMLSALTRLGLDHGAVPGRGRTPDELAEVVLSVVAARRTPR
ncbi:MULTISPECIES: (d)CMP kinase [unclassified Streptomyces]|uniref:(d)CMP kinase n=1 Tax=unclassified Streptomyces TaxID=2593676 RepID=UPI0021561C21|nr:MULTISPECIES: (d)CMP kinase [unclassified Streptomyces]